MIKRHILLLIFFLFLSVESACQTTASNSFEGNEQTDMIAKKLDLGNEDVMNTSVNIARDVPGEFSINQVGAIYNTLIDGWSYLSDPSFEESYKSASLTLEDGIRAGTIGAGDCDDFAILIASLIESLGGSTRIILAYDEETSQGHAYAELYLGQKGDPQLENLTKWIHEEYGVSSTIGLSYDGEDAWLNLDYNSSYIGGPFFGGERVNRKIVWIAGNKTAPKIIPLIDPIDDLGLWQATSDDFGSNVSLSLIPSRKAKALNLSFNLMQNGWIGIVRDLQPGILKDIKGINLSYFLNAGQVSLEILLRDENCTEFNIIRTISQDHPGWDYLEVLFEDLQGIDPAKVKTLELIVRNDPKKSDSSGRGSIALDQIRGVMQIPKDSPWAMAEEMRRSILARNLLMEADSLTSQRGDQMPLSTLLSIEAAELLPSWEAKKSLYEGLALLPRPLACFRHEGIAFDASSFSPDGRYFATAVNSRTAQVWNLTDGENVSLNDLLVELVLFSPDGKRLITAGWNGSIKIWSVPDFKERAIVNVTRNVIKDVAFSPDSRLLAITDLNITRVFNASDYQEIWRFDQKGRLTSLSFSADSRHIATAGHDRNVRIWDVESGKELEPIEHSVIVNSVAYSPDGRYLATTSGLNTRIWDMEAKPKEIMSLSHEDVVNCAVFSPDSRRIATASADNTARIWDLNSGQELTRMVHDSPVDFIEFSPNGAYISTGSWDNTTRIWDTRNWQGLTSVDSRMGMVSGCYFSADGKTLATVGGGAKVWNLSGELSQICRINDSTAFNLALSPGGRYLALSQLKGNMSIWNAITGVQLLSGRQEGNYTLLLFSPDEKYLITATEDGTVKGWSIDSSSEAFEYSHEEMVLWAAFDQESDTLTTVSKDGEAIAFNLKTMKESDRLKVKGEWIFAISRDGNLIASSYRIDPSQEVLSNLSSYLLAGDVTNTTSQYRLEVINRTSGEHVMSARIDNGDPSSSSLVSLKFSDDGKCIAAYGYSHAMVWRIEGGEQIADYVHTGIINRLAMSHDGEVLAASDGSGLVRIWNIKTGREILSMECGFALMDMIFSPDDRFLAAWTYDSKLNLWPLDHKVLISEARNRLARNITFEEWGRYLGKEAYPSEYWGEEKANHTWIDPEFIQECRYIAAQIRSQPLMIASPDSVEPGGPILVRYSGAPGNKGDWISIYPLGEKSENYGESFYLKNNVSGDLTFTAPSEEGLYHFRMFADWPTGGYKEIAISNTVRVAESVTPVLSLSTDLTSSTVNQAPRLISLMPGQPAPQKVGCKVIWTALASDAEEDPIYYKFLLSSPRASGFWLDQTGWRAENTWIWDTEDSDVGESSVQVQVIDGKHSPLDGWDDSVNATFIIMKSEDESAIEELGDTQSSEEWYERGNIKFMESNYQGAIDCYDQALKLNPMNIVAWTSKGNALNSLGLYDDAIYCYDRALEIDPDNEFALMGRSLSMSFRIFMGAQ